MTIKTGYKVKVEYEGKFENGEVFDSTEKHGGEPLEFVPGTGMLVPGFEKAVIGMKEGEEKEVTLKPEEAYGDHNPEFIQEVPKDKFPPEAKEGMLIGLPMPDGQQIPATIAKIGEKTVTLDMNSPLAGKTLVFKIKIVSFEEGDFAKEIAHSCGCGPHDKEDNCDCGDDCKCDEKNDSCCKDGDTEKNSCCKDGESKEDACGCACQ